MTTPSLDEFRLEAGAWLASVTERRTRAGADSVAVFDNHCPEQERATAVARTAWERLRYDAGWGAIDWDGQWGGRGLTPAHAWTYRNEERRFVTPPSNELFDVTQSLIAPTVLRWGTTEQKARLLRPLLRTDLLACQLFSEPGAGSDLAALTMRAVRDGDSWIISGQKVWTSGSSVADFGEAICRTGADNARHHNLTAFLIPMDSAGVTIRRIRQMTGGATFSEVFLDEVRVPDSLRLGPIDEGWSVALTTLSAERLNSAELGQGVVERVVDLFRCIGGGSRSRERVVQLWCHDRVQQWTVERTVAQVASGADPGVVGSTLKLAATQNMRRASDVVSSILGAHVIADTGEPDRYDWAEQILGAPGYRIAGGSDEIQRNLIAERSLGLPREPRPR